MKTAFWSASVAHAPYAVSLEFFQGALPGIPYLGTFIGVVVALIAVGSAQGLLKGIEAAALIALVHTVKGSLVVPSIFKKHVDVDPLGRVVATAAGQCSPLSPASSWPCPL